MLNKNPLAEHAIKFIDEKANKVFHESILDFLNDYFDKNSNIVNDVQWLRIRAESELEGSRIFNGFLARYIWSFPITFIERMQQQTVEEVRHYKILAALIKKLE